MPQSVLIQVGQCGNQIGFNFWKKLLEQYELDKELMDDYLLKPKLRSSESKAESCENLVEYFNPRCVLVDMEEKVINECCQGKYKNFFENQQKVVDVSGSGNNWFTGYTRYGSKHSNAIINAVRREVEACDTLDGFYFIYSIGGGTGSGLGSYILEKIYAEFPKKIRINFCVFPSSVGDVIISPYNALLANSKLNEFSSLTIPYENEVISGIVQNIEKPKFSRAQKKTASCDSTTKSMKESTPFPGINDIISSTISDFTGVLHFPGEQAGGASTLVSNLVPNQILNYVMPSSAPFIIAPEDCTLKQVINDLFSRQNFLIDIQTWPANRLLSSVVICRSKKFSSNDVRNNVIRVCNRIGMNAEWESNIHAWQCNTPPPRRSISTLYLANSDSMKEVFIKMKTKFEMLYQKRSFLHHFREVDTDFENTLDVARRKVDDIILEYESI